MGFWQSVLNIVGSVPVVGHVTAGVQYLAGDTDGAQKSLASSTRNLVSSLGATAGFVVGGPVGAVAFGTAGAVIGGQVENKINGKDLDLSPAKLANDVLMAGSFGYVNGDQLGPVLKSAGTVFG